MLENLDRILPRVAKPARYTGGEYNSVLKDIRSTDVRFVLAFPDTYEIGMSNLGVKILYHIINSRPDVFAERVFAPWTDMEAEMRTSGLPLFTLETRTPLAQADIIGFSMGYELSYTNVLNMLDLAGLPVRSSERTDKHPLVIAGGCCCFNPEPMADFIDAFVLGEGEEIVHELIDTFKEYRDDRNTLLQKLAQIEGIYVPGLYSVTCNADGAVAEIRPKDGAAPKVVKRFVSDLNAADFPVSPVMPFIETVHDRIQIEVMRGCTRGCRFCQAGMVYRPIRERSAKKIMKLADELCENTGYEEIALLSLSTPDHSEIEKMVRDLIDRYEPQKIGISLPSIRADADCVKLAAEIKKVRKTGLTLAPEAGTQRLRDVINKNVTDKDLFDAVEAAFRLGWKKVKLYFMIGLPTETDEDVVGIAELASAVAKIGRRIGIRPSVGVSVSCLVPKPHTPFQWLGQVSISEMERKQSILKQSLKDKSVNLSWHDPRTSRIEAVLARGDRRLGRAIENAWKSGCKFDAWHEEFDYKKWTDAFEKAGIDPAFYAERERTYDEILPWDHIDCGVDKKYLEKEAKSEKTTPDCREKCAGCGINRLAEAGNAACNA